MCPLPLEYYPASICYMCVFSYAGINHLFQRDNLCHKDRLMVCFPLTTSVYLNNNSQLLPLTSQKNCGANPLPSLINVAGCQNMQFFIFFSFPAFTTLILGEGGI